MFRPPSLLAPQIVPTAANTPAGQPGLLRPSKTRFVTSPRIGYANRPTTGNWRYGDLHPARLRPCRLLPSAVAPTGARLIARLPPAPPWRDPRWPSVLLTATKFRMHSNRRWTRRGFDRRRANPSRPRPRAA